jgi:hypothetical protein
MKRVLCLVALSPVLAFAQASTVSSPLSIPGDAIDRVDRLRVLTGQLSADGALLRVPAVRGELNDSHNVAIRFLTPSLVARWNSSLPWGGNDGMLRPTRGANALLTAGMAIRAGRVSVVVAPQMAHEANRPFFVIPWDQTRADRRSIWAHPYLPRPESADWPLRFGDRPRTSLGWGQSRVSIDLARNARLGFSNENRWWGPSAFNALLLSSNAPGFAHAFVEMPKPWRTRTGSFEAQYLLGTLRESAFFDLDRSNDSRTLSAVAVVWRPLERLEFLPTLGIARAVMSPGTPGVDDLLGAFQDVGRPVSRPGDIVRHGARDQITDLFLRWAVPESGVEAYAEWARYEFPSSFRDFIEFPGHSQGYTVGFQVARKSWRASTLHLQSEFTYTEPSPSLRVRPVALAYTSPAMPQGWTHDGQMLGPVIGPSGSSQHLAAEWHGRERRLGVSFTRVRWLNGPLFTEVVPGEQGKFPDLSLMGSLRAALPLFGMGTEIEIARGVRLAYFNQSLLRDPIRAYYDGIDYRIWSLSLTLTPSTQRFFFRP